MPATERERYETVRELALAITNATLRDDAKEARALLDDVASWRSGERELDRCYPINDDDHWEADLKEL
jgi:hypothetical protein